QSPRAVAVNGPYQRVLQKDGMARLQLCGKQTEGCDHREINFLRYSDKLRSFLSVEVRNCLMIARIDCDHVCLLIDNLGFVITHSVNFVRDLLKVRLLHDDTNQFAPPDSSSVPPDLLRRPPLVGERIKRELSVES